MGTMYVSIINLGDRFYLYSTTEIDGQITVNIERLN